MMRFLLPLLLFLAPSLSEAGGFRGVAALSAMSPIFPCDELMATLKGVPFPAVAVLWGTFGNDKSCLIRFLDANKTRPHALQIHFSNEACRRNNRCLAGEIRPTASVPIYNSYILGSPWVLALEIDTRMREIVDFVDAHKNENTTLVLSIGLEDNYTSASAQQLERMLRGYWPYFISRNPVNGKALVPSLNNIIESHDPMELKLPGPGCVFSEDGNSTSERLTRERMRRYRNCFMVLAWRRSWQNFGRADCASCKEPKTTVFIPPQERKFKMLAKDRLIINRILRAAP